MYLLFSQNIYSNVRIVEHNTASRDTNVPVGRKPGQQFCREFRDEIYHHPEHRLQCQQRRSYVGKQALWQVIRNIKKKVSNYI